MKLDLLNVRKGKKKKKNRNDYLLVVPSWAWLKMIKKLVALALSTATDIPFPGRSGPPAQSTKSNSITTAAGDLTNATLTITDDIIGGIGIENDIVMNVYSAHKEFC